MKRAVSVLNIYSRGCVPSHNRVCSAWMVSASGPNFNRPRGQSRVRGRDYMCHLWKRCANLTLVTLQSLIEAVKSGKRTGKTNNRVVNYYGNRIISCKPPILIVIGDQGDIIENTTIGILSGKKAICKRKERPHRVQPNEKISPETARRNCVNRIIWVIHTTSPCWRWLFDAPSLWLLWYLMTTFSPGSIQLAEGQHNRRVNWNSLKKYLPRTKGGVYRRGG